MHNNLKEFEGMTALVTGSSNGIGAAAAIEFARRGARVLIQYNRAKADADRVLDEVRKAGSGGEVFQADLSSQGGVHDVGRKKLDSAADTMLEINPNVQIDRFETALSSENALDILKDYDIVIDGTDNFPTRYLVNDACVLLKKPNVYGSIFRFEGQATVFAYQGGPCPTRLRGHRRRW